METALNYTDFAIESCIETLRLMHQYRYINLTMEAEFVLECMDCGVISTVMEAEAVNKSQSIFSKIKERIKEFFKKIVGIFKKRSVEKSEKYVPWIKDSIEDIKKSSLNATVEVTPYWESNWRQDIKQMTNAVNKIAQNIKSGRYEDYSFATDFVKIDKDVSSTANLKNKLITRFSIGEKDTVEIKKVKVEKFGSSRYLDEMYNFTTKEYGGDLQTAIAQLESTISRKMDEVNPKVISIESSTYLDIEDAPICETDLITLINYKDILTEAKRKNNKNNNKNNNQPITTKDSSGEKSSAQTVSINPDDEEGKGLAKDNEKENAEGNNDNSSNEAMSKYISQCELFMKLMVTSFTTANENRFITYVNTMVAIGNSKGKPTKDEDGKLEDKPEETPKEDTAKNDTKKKKIRNLFRRKAKRDEEVDVL